MWFRFLCQWQCPSPFPPRVSYSFQFGQVLHVECVTVCSRRSSPPMGSQRLQAHWVTNTATKTAIRWTQEDPLTQIATGEWARAVQLSSLWQGVCCVIIWHDVSNWTAIFHFGVAKRGKQLGENGGFEKRRGNIPNYWLDLEYCLVSFKFQPTEPEFEHLVSE